MEYPHRRTQAGATNPKLKDGKGMKRFRILARGPFNLFKLVRFLLNRGLSPKSPFLVGPGYKKAVPLLGRDGWIMSS